MRVQSYVEHGVKSEIISCLFSLIQGQGATSLLHRLQLAEKMGIKTDEMGPAYTTSMAAPGLEVAVTPLIGKLQLHIQGYVGHEQFFIMPFERCDVLLGMPWFYNHKTVLDSFNKKVTLEIRGRKIVLDVKLKGESMALVSASTVPRLMKQDIFASPPLTCRPVDLQYKAGYVWQYLYYATCTKNQKPKAPLAITEAGEPEEPSESIDAGKNSLEGAVGEPGAKRPKLVIKPLESQKEIVPLEKKEHDRSAPATIMLKKDKLRAIQKQMIKGKFIMDNFVHPELTNTVPVARFIPEQENVQAIIDGSAIAMQAGWNTIVHAMAQMMEAQARTPEMFKKQLDSEKQKTSKLSQSYSSGGASDSKGHVEELETLPEVKGETQSDPLEPQFEELEDIVKDVTIQLHCTHPLA
ncbi:hypothetical protein L7F22_031160 [Adiantum nelumboides]|nr:hypothetical protein [Adiantum nelumboides]